MIAFLDTPQEVRKPTFDEELVEKKLGWVRDFRSQLKDWGELFETITATESLSDTTVSIRAFIWNWSSICCRSQHRRNERKGCAAS